MDPSALPVLLFPSLQFQLASDYTSAGDRPFALKKGDVVEVLDNKIDDKWFVRTLAASPEACWVPANMLVSLGGDEIDGKSRTTITSG